MVPLRLTIVPVRDGARGGYYAVSYTERGRVYSSTPLVYSTEAEAIRALRQQLQAAPYNYPSERIDSESWQSTTQQKTQAKTCPPPKWGELAAEELPPR